METGEFLTNELNSAIEAHLYKRCKASASVLDPEAVQKLVRRRCEFQTVCLCLGMVDTLGNVD